MDSGVIPPFFFLSLSLNLTTLLSVYLYILSLLFVIKMEVFLIMTEKQFNNALQDSLMIDGIELEAFMAAKKVSDLCENTLTRTERNILLHLTRYGVKNLDDIEQYWGIPAERAKEIYDVALEKLKVAAGVC